MHHKGVLPLTAATLLLAVSCGGAGGTATSTAPGQGSATQSASPPPSGGVTQINVVGGSAGPNGSLTNAVAACVDLGAAGIQVTIRGTVSGSTYVLKFDAPSGATDLSRATTADITVLFAQLPSGSNWGADPRSQKGTGTLTVNGSAGGMVAVHLVAGAGSAVTDPVDVSGRYTCSSATTG